MKILKPILLIITVITLLNLNSFHCFAKIIEKIYADVNGEIITYSELKNAESEMTIMLSQQYKGEELTTKIKEMKENLLNRLIEQKLIMSYAKQKDYNVDGEVELIIKDIKKQNNINTDEELRSAIASQGINFEQWKKQLKETQIERRFIYDEIGSKIKVDSSVIMDYYKKNSDQFTKPAEFSLNCIFLNNENYLYKPAMKEKMDEISAELKSKTFKEVALEHSELPSGENKYFLGNFKKGELDPKIEETALKLKENEYSQWIETESGWYIVQLIKYTKPQLIEYKLVRDKIDQKLKMDELEKLRAEYLEELKKDSHIKIYE